MSRYELGQSIILGAVLLAALLFTLLVMIEISRLFILKEELNRAAEAAGKAGLIVVGDQIMAQGSAAGADPGNLDSMLTAPPIKTQVAAEVLNSLAKNSYHLNDPEIKKIQIEYPFNSHNKGFTIQVRLEKKVTSLFGDVLFIKDGVVIGQSIQTIPQR